MRDVFFSCVLCEFLFFLFFLTGINIFNYDIMYLGYYIFALPFLAEAVYDARAFFCCDVEETLSFLILVSFCKHANGNCFACVVEDRFD